MTDLLEGIRVIEMARLLNGDTLGSLLGDMGADVIKVELAPGGDYLRDILGTITAPRWSPQHLQVNRNKRSILLDHRTDEGRETLRQLTADADVFIDGNRGDWCDRNGLGYDELAKENPGLVYVQYTGFGRYGPYGDLPTHGNSQNSLAGDLAVERHEDDGLFWYRDKPGLMPHNHAGEATQLGAMFGAMYVAAALAGRDRRGKGCFIDVSGSDATACAGWMRAGYALNEDRIRDLEGIPAGAGNGPASDAKYQFYETKDHEVLLFCAIEPQFWTGWCDAVGRPDLALRHDHTRSVDFASGDVELMHEIQAEIEKRTTEEWMAIAVERGLPMTPTPQTYQRAQQDPHMKARGVYVEQDHPAIGPVTLVGSAAMVDGEVFRIRRHAPALGEHTDEILAELAERRSTS